MLLRYLKSKGVAFRTIVVSTASTVLAAATSPSITAGSGVPSGAPSVTSYGGAGSIYIRTNGTLYQWDGAAWNLLGGVQSASTWALLQTFTAGIHVVGTLTRTPGASTAAAGTTTADAGVLPAGTSSVYPTTAADDTAGVRVHASDKVTGRSFFVGNGVSNKILKVYPPSGGTINGAAADAAFSTASGKGCWLHCLNSTANTWLAC